MLEECSYLPSNAGIPDSLGPAAYHCYMLYTFTSSTLDSTSRVEKNRKASNLVAKRTAGSSGQLLSILL